MKKRKKPLTGEKIFDCVNILLVTIITLIIVLPVWNIVCIAFSSGQAIAEGKTVLWPREFSLENFHSVFADKTIWNAFGISVLKTGIGVVMHTFVCSMMAFAMSKKDLIGRPLYSVIGLITMFFSTISGSM